MAAALLGPTVAHRCFTCLAPPLPNRQYTAKLRSTPPLAALLRRRRYSAPPPLCTAPSGAEVEEQLEPPEIECVGTGLDVECLAEQPPEPPRPWSAAEEWWEWAVVVSPFFFWGTAMVAMKEVLPKAGPFFVAAFRLVPAGLLLVAFAAARRRPFPSGLSAWLSIAAFGLVDASCFQGFLAQGLQRTSAGLGSVGFA